MYKIERTGGGGQKSFSMNIHSVLEMGQVLVLELISPGIEAYITAYKNRH